MRKISALVVLLSTTGCIWSPANRTDREKETNIFLLGFVDEASAPVTLQARNYDTGVLDTLALTPISGPTDYDDSGLYAWSATLTPAMLPSKYWAPTQLGVLSLGTSSPGRLEVTGTGPSGRLVTFSKGAQECVNAEMDAGTAMVVAGQNCYDGTELIQFDQTGISNGADPGTWTAIAAGSGSDATARWDIGTYKSQQLDVLGIICRPLGAGPFPVHVWNHGGSLGLSAAEVESCKNWARAGWVMAMSAYRAEPLAYVGGSHAPDPDGRVEVCLGEVTDVMRLIQVLPTVATNANMSHVLMSGASHGGCVTARALERGAPVQAAIDVYGAADWSLTYNECVSPGLTFCDDLRANLQVWLGGTPAAKPIAYNWRSPRFKDAITGILAGDLTARQDVKILLQHGTADTIVYAKQSCMLTADALGTAKRYHVNTAGAGVTTSVPGCTSGWESTARPTTSWPNQSYLIVYDGYTHGGGTTLHACRDYYRFINALDWAADLSEAVACPGP